MRLAFYLCVLALLWMGVPLLAAWWIVTIGFQMFPWLPLPILFCLMARFAWRSHGV